MHTVSMAISTVQVFARKLLILINQFNKNVLGQITLFTSEKNMSFKIPSQPLFYISNDNGFINF